MAAPQPINLRDWVAGIRPQLQPPVGNKLLHGAGQHKVMVVGGPNARRDYHIEAGEELFLQLEGDMTLAVMEQGRPKDVPIRAGEIFLLPAHIPHSPQRLANTVGLVLERERLPGEQDALRWYCHGPEAAGRVLYEESFHCTDLGTQLRPVIERFNASQCAACGQPEHEYVAAGDGAIVPVDSTTALPAPINLRAWAAEHLAGGRNAVLYGPGAPAPHDRHEYRVEAKGGPDAAWQGVNWVAVTPGELFLYQVEGGADVRLREAASGAVHELQLRDEDTLLVPGGGVWEVQVQWRAEPRCLCLVVRNDRVKPR